MKKLLIILAFIIFGFSSTQAQIVEGNWKIGANVGLPVGDAEDYSNFQLGADVAYLFGLANIVEVGPMVGYSRFFVEDIETGFGDFDSEDISFLPVAASGRVDLGLLFAGLDLGYAVSLNDGGEGGVFYRPKVGVSLVGFSIVGSYSGISNDGDSLSSINIGVEFGL